MLRLESLRIRRSAPTDLLKSGMRFRMLRRSATRVSRRVESANYASRLPADGPTPSKRVARIISLIALLQARVSRGPSYIASGSANGRRSAPSLAAHLCSRTTVPRDARRPVLQDDRRCPITAAAPARRLTGLSKPRRRCRSSRRRSQSRACGEWRSTGRGTDGHSMRTTGRRR